MAHWTARAPIEIREIAPQLHAISASFVSPQGHHSHRHAYFLVRESGNLLFHGPDRAPFYKEFRAFFDDHGGIGKQVLTHAGDASPACAYVEKSWGAPVYVNQWELDEVRRRAHMPIDTGFANAHSMGKGLEALHMPGHAVGFTCFRYEIDGRKYLISGHIINQTSGGWASHFHPLLLEAGIRSLEALRNLDVDYLLPDKTQREPFPPLPFGPEDRAEVVERALQYLARKHRIAIE